jgi:predicted phage tail protein
MAQTKQSSLFNGAPIIREQGGIVPLCYGEGFAGGVLISSSITSTQG